MSVATKLQLKPGMSVRVLHAPPGIELDVPTTRSASADGVLVFVRTRADLAKRKAAAVTHARGDGIRPVRQVALNDMWSAMRFRPA